MFKAINGESWIDVYNRAYKILNELVTKNIKSDYSEWCLKSKSELKDTYQLNLENFEKKKLSSGSVNVNNSYTIRKSSNTSIYTNKSPEKNGSPIKKNEIISEVINVKTEVTSSHSNSKSIMNVNIMYYK